MSVFQFLVAAVIATVIYIRPASAFQPGSDYDVANATSLYNCTGHTPVSSVTVSNAIDTLPQISPSSSRGWEQWALAFHGTYQLIFRWNKGDLSSSDSDSSPARFDILVVVNETTIQGTVTGQLTYSNGESVKRIAIGNNSLTWDADGLWYNASVSFDGYQIELDSFSATLDSFHPNVALYNGLLDKSGAWFGSVPLIRGHVFGTFVTPSNQSIALDGLTVMRHMFSESALPSYINKYTGGTVWGYSTTFYDSLVFYHTETTNATAHESAFLGRAIPSPNVQGSFSSAWATYSVSDDDDLYSLNVDSALSSFDVSLSGCSNTSNIPYLFNATALSLFGTFTDADGGVTTYYTINGTTSAAFNGSLTRGEIAGFFEEYVAPSGGKN